jgi:hypothetical protein
MPHDVAASPRDLPSNTNAETQHSASNIGSTERSGFPRYVTWFIELTKA